MNRTTRVFFFGVVLIGVGMFIPTVFFPLGLVVILLGLFLSGQAAFSRDS